MKNTITAHGIATDSTKSYPTRSDMLFALLVDEDESVAREARFWIDELQALGHHYVRVMEARGWKLYANGGGNVCWQKRVGKTHYTITDGESPSAPAKLHAVPASLCQWEENKQGVERAAFKMFDSVADILDVKLTRNVAFDVHTGKPRDGWVDFDTL